MERLYTPVPDGEIAAWVRNASDKLGISREQFLMICVQEAWEKLYAKTFSWKEFTLVERKYLEKLESHKCGKVKG